MGKRINIKCSINGITAEDLLRHAEVTAMAAGYHAITAYIVGRRFFIDPKTKRNGARYIVVEERGRRSDEGTNYLAVSDATFAAFAALDKKDSAAEQAAECAIVAAYTEPALTRPQMITYANAAPAAHDKPPLYAESVQALLRNATHTLSPEDEAAARREARAKGWPDGLLEEYQHYITLLRQTKTVLDRIISLRATRLHCPEMQVLETERARLVNERLDASIHMRDTYTDVPEETKSELHYLVNLDKSVLST